MAKATVRKLLGDPAKRAEMIYGQPMNPCPQCGGFNIKVRRPIKMEPFTDDDGPRQWVAKWAKATRDGNTPLEGPVYLICGDCMHQGPAVDCAGRTSEEVGQDRQVASEVKRLWNSQQAGF